MELLTPQVPIHTVHDLVPPLVVLLQFVGEWGKDHLPISSYYAGTVHSAFLALCSFGKWTVGYLLCLVSSSPSRCYCMPSAMLAVLAGRQCSSPSCQSLHLCSWYSSGPCIKVHDHVVHDLDHLPIDQRWLLLEGIWWVLHPHTFPVLISGPSEIQ